MNDDSGLHDRADLGLRLLSARVLLLVASLAGGFGYATALLEPHLRSDIAEPKPDPSAPVLPACDWKAEYVAFRSRCTEKPGGYVTDLPSDLSDDGPLRHTPRCVVSAPGVEVEP